jgi:putative drug exporter of the RND superfamily
MAAALTLLPAMLGFIGPKVMSRKQKRNLAQNGPRVVGADNKGFWPHWADRVQRYPWLSALGALALIVLIAVPFFSLRLGSADQGTDPAGTPTRAAFDTLSRGFGPGFNGPLMLVSVVQPDQRAAVDNVVTAVSQQADVAKVAPPLLIPSKTGSGDVMLLNVYPKTAPQDVATTDLVNHLRSDTIPQAVGNSGLTILVGGTTAIYIDFANVLAAKLPLFIGLVVLLSFLLLMTVFRSFVIPLTAAAMNLLSIGCAFGILVAVFEWGYGGRIINITGTSPIEAFLPVMLFAILFGLSMDYQVFLVSRMHEEYIKSGGDNRVAVRNGLAATGKTITAAAVIMILVFGAFILGGERVIKEFGVGLAAGILVDAVLIRMCVVPSLMMMFGDANWWFPRWLDRLLPKLSVDADDLAVHAVEEPSEPVSELARSGSSSR